MRQDRLAGIVLMLGLLTFSAPACRADDERPGQILNFQTNVGAGYNCGRESSPLYCYGIPVNIGTGIGSNGTFWLDTYVSGYNVGKGFVLFSGVADLGEGTVTSNVSSTNNLGQVTQLIVNFSGATNDGDNGTYTGTMKLAFTYYYSSGGGGRGGGGAGWRFICTGGSVQITYA